MLPMAWHYTCVHTYTLRATHAHRHNVNFIPILRKTGRILTCPRPSAVVRPCSFLARLLPFFHLPGSMCRFLYRRPRTALGEQAKKRIIGTGRGVQWAQVRSMRYSLSISEW